MNILLGITGSISAYKGIEILRLLVKQGHRVKIILTSGGQKFVRSELFQHLGAEAVYCPGDDFKTAISEFATSSTILHIALARWADRFLIAPASANTLARLAQGHADDLLSSIFLCWEVEKPILIAPAMNPAMYSHPRTQANIDILRSISWVSFLNCDSGLLACGEVGIGRLPHEETIVSSICLWPKPKAKFQKNIIITAGATRAYLDPIRYITNPSSGITGQYLAQEFLKKDVQVTVIGGANTEALFSSMRQLPHFQWIKAITNQDMFEQVKLHLPLSDLYITAAAIGDWDFPYSEKKLKKGKSKQGELKYTVATDILRYVLENRRPEQKVVGFAAEGQMDLETLQQKYQSKPTDWLVGTKVQGETPEKKSEGFGNQERMEYLILKNGKVAQESIQSKIELAQYLVQETCR